VGSDGKPDNENTIRLIYEPDSFTPLARYKKGQLHYAVMDTVRRIQELLAEDGTIVWRGKQQLWGREESANDANVSCRLRFPGQYKDEESGLYYNRFRYYDCETGQYISADPVGLAGGENPYSYVKNPLRWTDPLGLAALEHRPDFDAARRAGFENANMTNPEDVSFSKVDPVTGTVVEFKGTNGAKVAYDAPHADMDATAGHDKPHVGWQSEGKRGSGGANRGNITYAGLQHPHRSDTKGEKC